MGNGTNRPGPTCGGARPPEEEFVKMINIVPPWKLKPLDEWSIIGMNHYHHNGEVFMFVAMTKGDRCIIEEGKDDKFLWNRLWHKATQKRVAASLRKH